MTITTSFQHPPAARRLLVMLLSLFLLAQTLGWMHRALHGAARPAQAAAAHAKEHAHGHAPETVSAPAGAVDSPAWVQALFGSHEDAAQCKIFDAVTYTGITPVGVFAPCLVPAALSLARSEAQFVARRAALFDARGPPVSRS